MKRLFLILLLLVLPIQMSWASASRYCLHEQGKAAQHFGHHEHKHHASASESIKEITSAKSSSAHTDCGVCQFSVTAITAMQFASMANYSPQATPVFREIDFFTSHRPDRPERPKWVRAV